MGKTNRARYTLEFKLEAVRLVGLGHVFFKKTDLLSNVTTVRR